MSKTKHNILGNITPAEFLKTYWQKQPCLIRQALPEYHCPLDPEDLAGLACVEGVEARLVINKGITRQWQVKYGPLHETDFLSLPGTHWALLVQGVEHYHDGFSTLLNHFSFIPNWRIDNVMISYAARDGGVGPHLDSYDVFLLQARGRRCWQINHCGYTDKDFIPDLELRIIDDFKPEEELVLAPGDMLYLPPGVAHNGIALEPGITLSIGFLAPSRSELATSFIDESVSGTLHDTRFTDPDRILQQHAGEISKSDLDRIAGMMRIMPAGDAQLKEWFGKYITRGFRIPKTKGRKKLAAEDFLTRFSDRRALWRSGGVRTAFIRQKKQLLLFVNGECLPLGNRYLPLVIMITEQTVIRYTELEHKALFREFSEILRGFFNKGIYHFR